MAVHLFPIPFLVRNPTPRPHGPQPARSSFVVDGFEVGAGAIRAVANIMQVAIGRPSFGSRSCSMRVDLLAVFLLCLLWTIAPADVQADVRRYVGFPVM